MPKHSLSLRWRAKYFPLAAAITFVFCPALHAETTTLLSSTSASLPGNKSSERPSISADGRYVAFQSSATDLIAADTNALTDIFFLDRQTGSMSRVSNGIAGAESNAASAVPAISAAGRYVAFESAASNLVAGDTNQVTDAFVVDTVSGTTVRVSLSSGGTPGNGDSFKPQLSSDGRFVTFMSDSTTLVTPDTNAASDVFLHDRDPDANGIYDEGNGTTVRASMTTTGVQLTAASNNPSISADGGVVAFTSGTGVYVYDRINVTTQNVSAASNGMSNSTSLSADGRYVAFASTAANLVTADTNASVSDVFVYDRALASMTLASVSQSGAQSANDSLSPVISADGRYVAFVTPSGSLNLKSIPNDLALDAVSAATGGGGGGGTATVYYVYRRDLSQGSTVRASSAYGGSLPNASSVTAAINGDGSLIAFSSFASNLTCSTDNNTAIDVFLRDLRSSTAPASCAAPSTAKSSGGGALGFALAALLVFRAARRFRNRITK